MTIDAPALRTLRLLCPLFDVYASPTQHGSYGVCRTDILATGFVASR